ncbi:MAG TPA: hypothetical protein VGI60_11650 [Chthoniobacterales bacterium]
MTRTEIAIQILTCAALVGLLGAVGLRLNYYQLRSALARCPLGKVILVNFVVIPALALSIAHIFGLNRSTIIAMVLLGAAPFAPAVPIFARMAGADLSLAAALTGMFPVVSVVVTPFAVRGALAFLNGQYALQFNVWSILTMLLAAITLPLAVGVLLKHAAPKLSRSLLHPVEVISETLGALSLMFVTVTQFHLIVSLGWRSWIAMTICFEASLFLGWLIGGPNYSARQVIALGSGNRNIALALLMAIESFHGMEVPSAVAGNGLLVIALGLLHVAWWRFGCRATHQANKT